MKLNLGCGKLGYDGYYGVDIRQVGATDILANLFCFPWPFQDDSVDEVMMSHFVEHIPALVREWLPASWFSWERVLELQATGYAKPFRIAGSALRLEPLWNENGFLRFFRELYRILKPNGIIEIWTPHYASESAFRDMTHTRYLTQFTFDHHSRGDATFDYETGFEFKQLGVEFLLWEPWATNAKTASESGMQAFIDGALQERWNVAHTLHFRLQKVPIGKNKKPPEETNET